MTKRLIFLGPPGAGKGTQAERICKIRNLLHLSTGDLLRAEVTAATSLGKEAEDLMNKGELVSDEIVLSIVEKKLLLANQGWLLDGFPRNVSQAESLGTLLEKVSQPIDLVILLEIDDEVLVERLIARGRADDNEKVIRNRLLVYREKTSPLINYYTKLGILTSVQARGNVEDISGMIEEKIG